MLSLFILPPALSVCLLISDAEIRGLPLKGLLLGAFRRKVLKIPEQRRPRGSSLLLQLWVDGAFSSVKKQISETFF